MTPEVDRHREIQALVWQFLTNPSARRDPRALYDQLLRHAPAVPVDDQGRMWVIAGYDEIVAVSKNSAATNDFTAAGIDLGRGFNISALLSKMLPMRTGADHRRLRGLVSTAFGARATATLRTQVERAIDVLLAPHVAAGHFDVVKDLAVPLPVEVSCAVMDIPAADRGQIADWAQLIAGSLLLADTPPETQHRLDTELLELRTYIGGLCSRRAKHPGPDLISRLVQAHADGVIDNDELVAFVVMLFVNGLDTLTSGLSAAVWHVMSDPKYLRSIRDDPDLGEPIFDECLRLAGPVRSSGRFITADIDLGRHQLRAGSAAILLYAAANRDPGRFPAPDRLDPHRSFTHHLAFGYGPHHCLGAPLSLLAGGSVLRYIAAHLPDISTRYTADTAPFDTSLVFAGLTELPVSFAPQPHPVTDHRPTSRPRELATAT